MGHRAEGSVCDEEGWWAELLIGQLVCWAKIGPTSGSENLYIFHKIFFFPTFQCLRFVQTIPPVRSSQPYPSSSSARCRRPACRARLPAAAALMGGAHRSARSMLPAPPAAAARMAAAPRCACCRCAPLPAAVVYWGARPLLRCACPPARERHRRR